MSDPYVEVLSEELAILLRAPIKHEPVSPPSSPNPVFAPLMFRLKSTAGRGRGRLSRNNPREEPPREPPSQPSQSRRGHRAASAGVPQPLRSVPPPAHTPDSPPEEINPRAIPKPGSRPPFQWFSCRPSTLTARTIGKYIRDFGLPEDTVEWATPTQRADQLGGVYYAWSRHNIRARDTLPLHEYFTGVANYFDIFPFQITPNRYFPFARVLHGCMIELHVCI